MFSAARDWLDKFSWFFRASNFCFSFYLNRKYYPKKNKKFRDHVEDTLVYLVSWAIVGLMYVLFVYLFVHESEKSTWIRLGDFLTSPEGAIRDVYTAVTATKTSTFFNGSFLAILYIALTSKAEKDFLKDAFTHLKISGLIKALKIGAFNEECILKEQSDAQLRIARDNIVEILGNPTVELITIVTASGWDFFGNGTAIPVQETLEEERNKSQKKNKKSEPLKNGYLLDLIKRRQKTVQILLLDPDSPELSNRAEGYMKDGAHNNVVKSVEEYKRNINVCIKNISEAFKLNKNIELRLCSSVPQWKMVFAEREVWVQPILDGFRSDHTPLYGFSKTDHSIYHAFWNISEEVWHRSKKVDLATLAASSSGSS